MVTDTTKALPEAKNFDHDMVEAAKAVHDSLKSHVDSRINSLEAKIPGQVVKVLETLQSRVLIAEKNISDYYKKLGDLENGVAHYVGQVVEKLLNEQITIQIKSLTESYREKLLELDKANRTREMDSITRVSKALEGEFTKRLEAIAGQKGDYLTSLQKSHEMGYQLGLDQIKTMLQALPIPQVNVNIPEHAIQIKQLPSQVNVTVPEHAIEVKMLPSQVILPENAIQMKMLPSQVDIHMPEMKQEKSIINISVPEQKAPDVHVNVPRRKITKHISYDEIGRPSEIKELEEEEK